jgi:GT2 family glycosyltransferase
MELVRIVALVACHNRRDRTLACLDSYYRQTVGEHELGAVLVDDGSSDDTAHAVRSRFPRTRVEVGDGSLFWAAAMARAEAVAARDAPDYLLWLNDDVVLDQDGLSTLLDTAAVRKNESIVVGAVRDPVDGTVTYGGAHHDGLHPLRMSTVPPGDEPIEVETFNGNVVLVARAVAQRVGPIDGAFAHAAADFDYGLRARRLGVRSLLAPGTVGTCPRTRASSPWLDCRLSRRARVAALVGPKGIPPRSTARYLRRHGGRGWPLFWAASYVKALSSLARTPRGAGSS